MSKTFIKEIFDKGENKKGTTLPTRKKNTMKAINEGFDDHLNERPLYGNQVGFLCDVQDYRGRLITVFKRPLSNAKIEYMERQRKIISKLVMTVVDLYLNPDDFPEDME